MGRMDAQHLIVDGHNVIHAWADLRQFLGKHMDVAVARLTDAVRCIHDADGLQVTLVLDGKGTRLSLEHPDKRESFTVVYAPAGVTADTVIEQMLRRAGEATGFVVATRDNALGLSARVGGARCITPDELERWVTDAGRRMSSRVASIRNENARRWSRRAP